MPRDTTVIAFRQPEAIDDPLTEVAREGARRMLAQVLIAEADSFVAMWKDLRLPDGRDRIVRRAGGRDHARRGSLNRWHQEPSSDKFLVMCRHLECWQPRCQRRLRLTFFSLRWRSMAEGPSAEKSTLVTVAFKPSEVLDSLASLISTVPGEPRTAGTTLRASASSAARTRTIATSFT